MDASTITTMLPSERRRFEDVANTCSIDVDRICSSVALPHPMVSFSSSPMDDFGSIVDGLMRSFLEVPEHQPAASVSPQRETVPSLEDSRGLESPVDNNVEGDHPIIIIRSSFSSNGPCEEELIRHMLSHFAPIFPLEETEVLAQRLSDHGREMLTRIPAEEEENQEARIARRLSEVSPEEVMEHRRKVLLPFSSDKNDCLLTAYQNSLVSEPCGQAIQNLEHVRAAQYHYQMYERQASLEAFTNLFLVYFLVLSTVVVLFLRRKNLFKVKRHLAASIFRTIYSKPELKSAVEKELGHPIGNEIPRPWKALKDGFQKLRKLVTVLMFASILSMLGVISITTALHVGVIVSAYVFIRVVLMKPWTGVEDNSTVGGCCDNCCCCNKSSPDMENGVAGCCDDCCCCNKSSPDMKNGMDGCCDNCCDDCCCCNKSTPGMESDMGGCCDDCCCCDHSSPDKKVMKPRQEIYEGIPIQIV